MTKTPEGWGTRIGLILAVAGNAIGLGNFLRFPMQAADNGGGAFIIPYLVCLVLMGLPLLWVEWAIGRYGGQFGKHAPPFILAKLGKHPIWRYIGVLGLFITIGVAGYYCYIEAWTLSYLYHTLKQSFDGLNQPQTAQFFKDYTQLGAAFGYEQLLFFVLCLVLNVWILSKGLNAGVEKTAKFGMPLLFIFAGFLAVMGLTMTDRYAPAGCNDCNALLGINFLWTPQLDKLADPAVWLAAAGQIFFTLAVGMGSIHCYASYLQNTDDIALNAMAAGWMNTFVEVVLGAAIVIPIATGFLGLGWVKDNASFYMGFQTMPFLFSQWGTVLGTLAGVMWFGLLFFAGVTSSLAMGMPWLSFLQDEFGKSRQWGAVSFGLLALMIGLPAVIFFHEGVLDELDYWVGSVALVVFAFAECIAFAWVFGINRGWALITAGADMKVPTFYKFIIKYVTTGFIALVLLASLFKPKDNDWTAVFAGTYQLDPSSVIGKVLYLEAVANRQSIAQHLEAETNGTVTAVTKNQISVLTPDGKTIHHQLLNGDNVTVLVGEVVTTGQRIAEGGIRFNRTFYLTAARLLMLILFLFLGWMVWRASKQ